MTARSPTIADLAGEPWVLLHPDDAAAAGIADGDAVVVESAGASVALRSRVSDAVRRGDVFVPRGFDATPVNKLTDGDPRVMVRIRALAAVAGSTGGT